MSFVETVDKLALTKSEFFFFFYYSAPPRNLPSSPPRPSPDPAPRQQPFQSAEPLGDPMIVPCLDGRFVLPKRPKQVAEHPEIVDRMNVASDHCRQCPHPGAALCIGRQEWRLGVCLIEIIDDRQRLDQERVIDLHRRDKTLWI